MAWSDFQKTWRVTGGSSVLGTSTVLTFEGNGSGDATSRLMHSGGEWGTQAKHVGGSGTDGDPEVVTLKRGGSDYVIGRSGNRIRCYPGATFPQGITWSRGEENSGRGDGTESKPIWEAQEGG